MRLRVAALMFSVFLFSACAPGMGPMTVVGKDAKAVLDAGVGCVRYRAFGRTEETCPVILDGKTSLKDTQCWKEAVVGKPLPESCR